MDSVFGRTFELRLCLSFDECSAVVVFVVVVFGSEVRFLLLLFVRTFPGDEWGLLLLLLLEVVLK